MEDLGEAFKGEIVKRMDLILKEQKDNIDKATKLLIESLNNGKLIYVFGTGHSMMLAMEVFYRAGGLIPVCPLFDLSVSGFNGAFKSTLIERLSGYAKALLEYYRPESGSCLIVISNSGVNAVPVEIAYEASKSGLKVIALTSVSYSKSLKPRNPLGKRLYEIADVVIDNYVPEGDAVMRLDGFPQKVGPVSTAINSFILQLMVVKVAKAMLDAGLTPPVWMSANVPGGDQHNLKYLRTYMSKIKAL